MAKNLISQIPQAIFSIVVNHPMIVYMHCVSVIIRISVCMSVSVCMCVSVSVSVCVCAYVTTSVCMCMYIIMWYTFDMCMCVYVDWLTSTVSLT